MGTQKVAAGRARRNSIVWFGRAQHGLKPTYTGRKLPTDLVPGVDEAHAQREWNKTIPDHQREFALAVIPGTSKGVRGFVENVNRISATEVVEHERMW